MSVIAILCSDIHLSHKPPIARGGEPDWYEAMARPLRELDNLREEHEAPIICAGDIFHNWNPCPRLINFAINSLPEMWAIPGQHDLPYHQNEKITDSAFWTLALEGTIHPLKEGQEVFFEDSPLLVTGFPWDAKPAPPKGKARKGGIRLGVLHRYVWKPGHSYPGAPNTSEVEEVRWDLKGFDVAAFGDNHSGFLHDDGDKPIVFNCGALMRRRADEEKYRPQVGLLHEDGHVEVYHLDTSKDIFNPDPSPKIIPEGNEKAHEFLDELERLQEVGLDFEVATKRVLDEMDPPKAVREILLKAMEGTL